MSGKFRDRDLGVRRYHVIELVRVNHNAGIFVSLFHCGRVQCLALGLDHNLDRYVILFCKLEIPLVVSRHSHNRAGAVFHENKICSVDRQPVSIIWIDAKASRENAFFFRFIFRLLPLFFNFCLFNKFVDRFFSVRPLHKTRQHGMLRGNGHKGCAVNGIRTGRENLEAFT